MRGINWVAASLLIAMAPAGPGVAQPAAAAAPASGPAAAGSSPAAGIAALQPNVLTVQALIKAENELAIAKARREHVAAGLDLELAVPGARRKGPAPMSVQVESIAGAQAQLRASLYADGQPFEGVSVGARVHGCRIEAIEQRCVVFKPAARGVQPQQCPTACWTGTRTEPSAATLAGIPAGLPAGALQGPLPAATSAHAARSSRPAAPLPLATGMR
ncbi:hypothetical protein [Ramlibacter sp. AN1133]|uniref:hypothetical protein n=1 Tax=Ramlibacter sp. AN1133 TaxID=3133429 RepID=UPI0030BD8499